MKRDTVCAPPSIRMRPKPRSASAARIAAGAISPPGAGTATISTPAGSFGVTPSAVMTSRRTPSSASTLASGDRRPRGIEHDARRARPCAAPDGEQRIVGDRRADADQHRIDQRAQPVQVRQAGRTVDVFGMSGDRRDPPVDRLTDLADHHEVVDRAPAQRPEPRLPRLRQRGTRRRENCLELLTSRRRYRSALSGSTASVMCSRPASPAKGRGQLCRTMIFDD